jgi:inhibitor of KinA sporulation pathway (predicted exonuclease)
VKPTVSTVSQFCTSLTSITTELLAAEGVSLPEAFASLKDIVDQTAAVASTNGGNFAWASWGDYDCKMFNKQSHLFGLNHPLRMPGSTDERHFNVKTIARNPRMQSLTGYTGSDQQTAKLTGWRMDVAYEGILGREIEGTHHRGGDDAFNIA